MDFIIFVVFVVVVGLVVGFVVIGFGIGQGIVFGGVVEGIVCQFEVEGKICGILLLFLVFMELLIIYGLVVVLVFLFVNFFVG